MNRQQKLDKFRASLSLPKLIITDKTKQPFTDSLREIRQQELDNFRSSLGLTKWEITNNTKSPFSESLREYSMEDPVSRNYHCEMTYDEDNVIVSMTFMNDHIKVAGKVFKQSLTERDGLDDLQDEAAKKLVKIEK